MTRADVYELLDSIVDPCSQAAGTPIGIVAMGLVTTVEVTPVSRETVEVEVALGVTDPVCWMGAAFVAEARRVLVERAGIGRVTVLIDADLDWTEALMEPAARQRLEQARAARRGRLPVVQLVDAGTGITRSKRED